MQDKLTRRMAQRSEMIRRRHIFTWHTNKQARALRAHILESKAKGNEA